jgi:hypothetical protein
VQSKTAQTRDSRGLWHTRETETRKQQEMTGTAFVFSPYDLALLLSKDIRYISINIEPTTMTREEFARDFMSVIKVVARQSDVCFLLPGAGTFERLAFFCIETMFPAAHAVMLLSAADAEPKNIDKEKKWRIEVVDRNELMEFLPCISDGRIARSADSALVGFVEVQRAAVPRQFYPLGMFASHGAVDAASATLPVYQTPTDNPFAL